MRRLALIAVCALLSMPCRAAARTDSTLVGFSPLDSLLVQFFDILQIEDTQFKNREYDSMIGSCKDSLTRQKVALKIFDHYSHSRLMGEESVAIHIYDEWIATGKVKARSEFDQNDMWRFVEFNRNTQIGMKAPQVTLLKSCGAKISVPLEGSVGVLFFYDATCSKCILTAKLLPTVLDKAGFPLTLYAVYSGSDRKEWNRFRHQNIKVRNPKVKVLHLWDPEMDSNYGLLYGVLATPRMYVCLEDGEIIGRKLEVENLQQIIDYISIRYGKEK